MLQLLENVRERVKGGELLSDAFAAQQVFPKMYTTTLLAGEKSGNMEEVLSRYIAYQRMVQTFRKKLLGFAGVSGAADCRRHVMLIFLITYVVPKFADLFNNLGAELADDHGVHAGHRPERAEVCVGGCVVLVVGGLLLWRWKQSDRGAEQIDHFLLALPLIGEIRLKYQVANFSRMLATLLQGGLPLVPAMETAGASMSSRQMLNGIIACGGARTRRPEPGAKPGGAEAVSRSGGRNAGSGRIDGRAAGDAELGGGVLRGRRADGAGSGYGAD